MQISLIAIAHKEIIKAVTLKRHTITAHYLPDMLHPGTHN